METKAENPVALLTGEEIPPIIRAYFEFNQLKQLYRQGWLLRGVPKARAESVAEHSLGVAVLALWLADAYYPYLDTKKVLQMALLHDFGEIYAGDFVPGDPISAQEKSALEAKSVEQVLRKLPHGKTYLARWQEFEAGQSPEARFVRQIDRLEMGLQATLYRAQGFDRMEEFLQSARQALSDPELIELMGQAASLHAQESDS